MEVINQTTEWFKTDEAISMYNSLESLADKTVFLFSYLKTVANTAFDEEQIFEEEISEKYEDLEEDECDDFDANEFSNEYEEEFNENLYKLAFLLADEISNSNLPYSDYNSLVDANTNPFVAYIEKAPRYIADEMFITSSAILLGDVDPFDSASWIYNKKYYSDSDIFSEKAREMGCRYTTKHLLPIDLVRFNLELFDTTEPYQTILLEIYWLFGQTYAVMIKE